MRLVLRISSFILVLFVLLLACPFWQGAGKQSNPEPEPSPPGDVSPVTGQSWLKHLDLTQSQTQIGQLGGSESIPATRRKEPNLEGSGATESFVLAGADLYRLNCRSCHGADGKGSPPEINSLLGPVQAASAAAFQERMKARGTEVSREMATEMAAQAAKSLRDRLQNGGKAMPAFNYLRENEIEALLAYLDQLAGVPAGKNRDLLVTESAAHVGEQMMKGTCHLCHDATGPGVGHMGMMHGIIPSLASMPREHSLNAFARQIQRGTSRMGMMMGMRMMAGRRMPPFPYFTPEEVAAAYSYLGQYPPRP